MRIIYIIVLMFVLCINNTEGQEKNIKTNIKLVSEEKLSEIYDEIKTPYKYGVVFKHPDKNKMVDSPTIYRLGDNWYMSYIIFDGKGYETWLAKSSDLLNWESLGRVMTSTKNTWDGNQKAGYVSLIDINWGGSYEPEKFNDSYWISYLGGPSEGYESGILSIGIAHTSDLSSSKEWTRLEKPVLTPRDESVRWFENKTIYKSLIIRDKVEHTGYPFIMYYNAKGDTAKYESIGMAVSDDMISWKRFGDNPVITFQKGKTISGDAQIAKTGDIYVMFFFRALWDEKHSAVEKFACSYDLINWTEWKGENLIEPSEPYDKKYSHKPWVIKWNGVVYHFYNAVGSEGRVIALATSKSLRK